MTAYQVMPGLTAEEYASLREDIALHGVRVPVDVDENGQVLDGHHRSLIAAELGLDCPRRVIEGLTEAEKVAHALAVNVHRRNLTREQRRELIAASLRAEPEASDVEHARRTGVSDKTVADQRRQMEGRSEIPNVESRTDTRGRQQPASKPAKVTETTRESTSVKTEYEVDTDTGEILDDEPAPEPAPPRQTYTRIDVVREVNKALYHAGQAAQAAEHIRREHLRQRNEEAAVWVGRLSTPLAELQRLHDALQEASA